MSVVINIARIRKPVEEYAGEEPASVFELDNDEEARPAGPLLYRLTVELVHDRLVVRARVSAAFKLRCRRCVGYFDATLRDEDMLRSYEIASDTEFVDLTDDLREAIILALPSYPLCASECKGLCPQCGANLNEGMCACPAPPADEKWRGLDGLRLES